MGKNEGHPTVKSVAFITLTEGLSVLRTEMKFSWDRLQLTGALEGSDCRVICKELSKR